MLGIVLCPHTTWVPKSTISFLQPGSDSGLPPSTQGQGGSKGEESRNSVLFGAHSPAGARGPEGRPGGGDEAEGGTAVGLIRLTLHQKLRELDNDDLSSVPYFLGETKGKAESTGVCLR